MARFEKPALLDKVVQSIRSSGWNVLYLGGLHDHPLRLHIYRGDERHRVRAYIWNVTHGGGQARPVHEYRIQITGVDSLDPEPSGKTLLLGWWQEDSASAFVGFDFRRHEGPVAHSPSIQIGKEALLRAHEKGFAPYNRGNGEIAIAFAPDFMIEYVRDLEQLHGFGETAPDLKLLDTVSEDPQAVPDEILADVTKERKEVIASIRRRLRYARFREKVLAAYGFRCAICGLQLDLVEAAHIVPVADNRSVDETFNGLALCALHHKAFDAALVTINDTYRAMINKAEIDRLRHIGHDGGLDDFIQGIRSPINVPRLVVHRPRTDYIQVANSVRGWRDLLPDQIDTI